jgi:hypothetical protein
MRHEGYEGPQFADDVNSKMINYTQVYKDFGLELAEQVPKSVLVLAPISLEIEEIRDRNGDELIFARSSMVAKKEYYIEGVPEIHDEEFYADPPVVLLIPNFRCHY